MLSYGIPEFRLPKSIVNREVAELEKLGVKIETNAVIGRTLTVDDLFEQGFEAVFLGFRVPVCPNLWAFPAKN